MSKDQDSKEESVPLSDAAKEKPGRSQDTSDRADLRIVEVLGVEGQSALVEYDNDGIPCRAYVDPNDIVDGMCSQERLDDAPYGITWKFDIPDLARATELELKRAQIWTYADLVQKDREIIRIATNLLGRAIWAAAKSGCKRR